MPKGIVNLKGKTEINDIVITGDFNINMINSTAVRHIITLCQQYSHSQYVSAPIYYTDHSSSSIDIILTSQPIHISNAGVSDTVQIKNTLQYPIVLTPKKINTSLSIDTFGISTRPTINFLAINQIVLG